MKDPLKINVWGVLGTLVVVGLGIWWITQPEPIAPAPVPATPAPYKPDPIRVGKTPDVVPEATTAEKPAPPPVPQPAPEVAAALHSEVNAAIADYLTLLNAEDFAALLTKYTAPDQLAANLKSMGLTLDQLVEKYKENPLLRHELQNTASTLTAIKDATPTYNEAGDQAIYKLDPPIAGRTQASWSKINGQWYLDE